MKKKILLTLLLFAAIISQAQNELWLYPEPFTPVVTPPKAMTVENPSTIPLLGKSPEPCGTLAPFQVGYNTDFTVMVKKGAANSGETYMNLFEYNTFVNSSSGDLSKVTRSSFVTFDYSGTVTLLIKCNFAAFTASEVVIRPLSRNIQPVMTSYNEFTITLTNTDTAILDALASDKLSVEITGNRYSNLQVFANRKYVPPTPAPVYDKIYYASNNGKALNVYDSELNTQNKKILIKEGAIVTVPYSGPIYSPSNGTIVLKTNDEIYFERGAILNGGVMISDANNVKVHGRGIIDLTNLPKKYTSEDVNDYAYIQAITLRNADRITLDGLIVNDSQQLCVEVTDCGGTLADPVDNIKINNMKLFTRAIWGDGYHFRGTSNVSINDCFNRTSDDCISIYASRRQKWDQCFTYPSYPACTEPNCVYPPYIVCDPLSTVPYKDRDALNFKVTNTLLYADNAHAIEIGWHGNQLYNNGKSIYNLYFEKIDILEHDSKWVQQNGTTLSTYEGAIGINCADDNICGNFLFKKINVEDFTAGSLLAIRVMPYGEGDAIRSGRVVQDIRFEDLSYTGSSTRKSIISGVDCTRFVNGVHFENLKIGGTTVLSTNMSNYFTTNDFAYNITFNEQNNYSTVLESNAEYTIKNSSTGKYLQYSGSGLQVVASATSAGSPVANNKTWKLVLTGGHYLIKPKGVSLNVENTFEQQGTSTAALCAGRLVKTMGVTGNTNQEWKIVPVVGQPDVYTINNAYTRAYLNANGNVVSSNPKTDSSAQKWVITKIASTSKMADTGTDETITTIKVYPNPAKDFLHVDNPQYQEGSRLDIFSINGSRITEKVLDGKNSEIYIGNLPDGIYIVTIKDQENVVYSEKFVKTH